MAAKSKKDETQPTPKTTKADHVINVKGGIHAGRDVIQGNQTNHITYTSTQIANLQSPAEFVNVLQQVQAQLADLKKTELSKVQARNLETVEGLVLDAVEETRKPQPAPTRIKETLSEAKETLELLGGSLGAASALGTTIGGLIVMAFKLFGG